MIQERAQVQTKALLPGGIARAATNPGKMCASSKKKGASQMKEHLTGSGRTKFTLEEKDMPTSWYNILADLPFQMAPPLNPKTMEPVTPEELASIFPTAVIEQEVSKQPAIDIPGEVLDIYRLWRPTPLVRARRLEQALGTPAKVYFKYEGTSPVGSHKPNTAVAQAYYNKKEGVRRLSTETGAGQWGSALSMACAFFGLECIVYMVKASYHQKPYRRSLMQTFGAHVIPSPSNSTASGRAILAKDPESPGSLGIAISEAVEDTNKHPGTRYSLGSVLNHVLMHQTIIGLEARRQMELAGDTPDTIVACAGGGSNFGGLVFPFLEPVLKRAKNAKESVPEGLHSSPNIIAVEPEACPTLTKGLYTYDYGDCAGKVPALKMHTLGHDFVPPGFHAGGLRYHGMSPIISALLHEGFISARAVKQLAVFEAAELFARTEGILPAPESAHAIRTAIDLAIESKESGKGQVILFGLSGHGYFDMTAYEEYRNGLLKDIIYPQSEIDKTLSTLVKKERFDCCRPLSPCKEG
jgi:tryptophan synthase beta chain